MTTLSSIPSSTGSRGLTMACSSSRRVAPAMTVSLALIAACPGDSAGSTADGSTSPSTSSGTGSTTGPGAPTSGTGASPGDPDLFVGGPRWVLRDRDGVRVQALVEPRCGAEYVAHPDCVPLGFDSPNSFPCVRIVAHEDRYLNLEYELKSGLIDPCNRGYYNEIGYDQKSLSKIVGLGYLNAQCEGTIVGTDLARDDSGPEFTGSRKTFYIAGDVWAFDEPCVNAPVWIRQQDLSCLGPFGFGLECPLSPIPDWAKNLLPNPPYTLDVEYGEKP